MASLVITTNYFPFNKGEAFLEEEIKYWKDTAFDNIYIIPINSRGVARPCPNEINVLKSHKKPSVNLLALLNTITSSKFYYELFYILKVKEIQKTPKCLLEAGKAIFLTMRAKEIIKAAIKGIDETNELICYNYWNSHAAYASILLKNKKIFSKVYSRIHGGDLYEYRYETNYIPLKRQFIAGFDKIFFLSDNAKKYFQHTYNAKDQELVITPLGVKIPIVPINPSDENNSINLLSIAYCTEVKQIDKTILALREFSNLNPNISIQWNHIGDGPLMEKLENLAKTAVEKHPNLKIKFLGHMTNQNIHNHIKNNGYDAFINTSRSEGMPVTIMEAMSYGIPAIAPDIGEISSLVNNDNGILLPAEFSSNDIVKALSYLEGLNTQSICRLRDNARNWIISNFNAYYNYKKFIRLIESDSFLPC